MTFAVLSFLYFNSQPHKEADGTMAQKSAYEIAFQLTASQGG